MKNPSGIDTWLLSLLVRECDREMLLGDLIEERALHDSPDWFHRQVWKSFGPIIWANIRRGGWLKTLGAAFLGYIVVSMLVIASDILMSKLIHGSPFFYSLVSLAAGFPAMMLGGYLAARIRPRAAGALAAMAALLGIVSLFPTGDGAPLWYRLALIVIGPIGSLTGGQFWKSNK